MNKVYLIGNMTKDVELFETTSGLRIVKFSVAVNRNYSNEDGERITDFFNVVAWRNLADSCKKYLRKGSKVAVVGSLQNRSYEDKDGVSRRVTEIIATEVEFLSMPNNKEDAQVYQRNL